MLPASVNKAIYFAIAPNNNRQFRFYSYDLDESYDTLEGNEPEIIEVVIENGT